MKNLAIVSLLFVAFVFTGCEETKRVIDTAGSIQLSGNYTVTSIEGVSSMSSSKSQANITFAALDKSINGSTGCNTFFGNYTIDLYTLTFGEIAATKKACSESAMTYESSFLQALANTGSYNLQNNILTLYSKTDRTVLLTANKETQQ